ncbi:MAG: glycosyltransferase family 2 protein [Actinobacteria bacterium]|nr:glycosyltransferase family 2 protein [Actinomycetota bacterium]
MPTTPSGSAIVWAPSVPGHPSEPCATEAPAQPPRKVTVDANERSVTAYVANLNTARATELCIRSMRHFAGHPFELVVGDCGSTDGSLKLLERFADKGWLRLEVAPNGRRHPEWLSSWLAECPSRYALFSDSDVEYRSPGWLADMVATATATGAALVCGRMQQETECFVHPVTKAERRLAARPTAWLLMLDTAQVRGRVDGNFDYHEVENFDAFGGKVAYDTAAWYFHQLREAGLPWAEMPRSWQHSYRHFGGLTWLGPLRSGPAWRTRAKQMAKLVIVQAHLRRAQREGWGNTVATASEPGLARPAAAEQTTG